MSYLNNFKTAIEIKLGSNKKKKNKVDDNDIKSQSSNSELEKEITNQTKNTVRNDAPKTVTKSNANEETKLKQEIVTGKVTLEATPNDNPEEKLQELNDRYELLEFYDAPDSLGLETKEVPVFDEEKVRKNAESQIGKVFEETKNQKQDDYKQALLELDEQKSVAKVNATESEKAINKIFDDETFAVENQAIKRGLARSSIVLGQLSRVESERAESLIENMNNLSSKLNSIEAKIQDKRTELDKALENLDIEKAEKIEESIQKAYEDFQDAYDEVVEFNNNVKKLEAEYKIKYEKEKAAFKEDILELTQYGYDEYRKKLEMSKYNYMVSYLSQFNKDEAFEIFFRNSNFKELLGDNYQKVVDYLYNRT
ncbi:MAG: hypothetical protein IJW24_02715 [Clostridia bacterium]|nr:hypothetical protein [Clostridia bacterium]